MSSELPHFANASQSMLAEKRRAYQQLCRIYRYRDCPRTKAKYKALLLKLESVVLDVDTSSETLLFCVTPELKIPIASYDGSIPDNQTLAGVIEFLMRDEPDSDPFQSKAFIRRLLFDTMSVRWMLMDQKYRGFISNFLQREFTDMDIATTIAKRLSEVMTNPEQRIPWDGKLYTEASVK